MQTVCLPARNLTLPVARQLSSRHLEMHTFVLDIIPRSVPYSNILTAAEKEGYTVA